MKKLTIALICALSLCGCAANTDAPQSSPEPTAQTAVQDKNSAVKTMIAPSDKSPIGEDWTTLGEAMLPIGADFGDVYLATDAHRGADGYMMWDDLQSWAVTVEVDSKTYVLLDEKLHGKVYIDVETRGTTPVVTVLHTSTVGLNVTEYVYEDGSFYAEKVIEADDNGNNIYSSIPEYIEE